MHVFTKQHYIHDSNYQFLREDKSNILLFRKINDIKRSTYTSYRGTSKYDEKNQAFDEVYQY